VQSNSYETEDRGAVVKACGSRIPGRLWGRVILRGVRRTMLVTLASAGHPPRFIVPLDSTLSAIRRASPHRSASRITGTSPAHALMSSNAADTTEAAWEISEVPC
jgi:hypothetical protein